MQGIEKKTTKLQGSEKAVVARHEAGHAVVGTAVANLLSGQPRVEVLLWSFGQSSCISIIVFTPYKFISLTLMVQVA